MNNDQSFANAVDYIDGIVRFTTKNDPAVTRAYLKELGDPDLAFPSVHIAGTNGKGSTCAFIEAALRKAGYKTGLFTSPHLSDIRERFLIDGKMPDEETFVRAYERVRGAVCALQAKGLPHPSWFEFLYLAGMVLFAEAGIDIAVLETGLGGRLDATNATGRVILTVLTKIGLDHTKILGETLGEIAAEKAGIMKEGVPCVCLAGADPVMEVFRDTARERGVKLTETAHAAVIRPAAGGIDFLPAFEYDGNEYYHVPFSAPYQADNASLALAALRELAGCGFVIAPETIREAFADVRWQGRMQMIAEDVYADGAHNPDGVAAFCDAAAILPAKPCILLFGAMRDKDWPAMVRILTEKLAPEYVITVCPEEGRGVPAKQMLQAFLDASVPEGFAAENAQQAMDKACAERRGRRLFAAGSLYLVGKVLTYDQF